MLGQGLESPQEFTPPKGDPTGQRPLDGQHRPFLQLYPEGQGEFAEQGLGEARGVSPRQTSLLLELVSEQQTPPLKIVDWVQTKPSGQLASSPTVHWT